MLPCLLTFLESSQQVSPTLAKVEELMSDKPSFDEECAPQEELTRLTSSLRYEFLRHNFTYPVIVNANLSVC